MPTVISALLPNTQFTQAGTANTLLTPLVNDAITVEGTPKIWLCGPDGKGSLHTLDYSGNPSEIIICPNSPPNTTTNKQNFMYYRNVGGNWIPSGVNYNLPWVPWGTRLITGNYTDPTALDGQFLWTNFTQQDPLRTTVAPYPLTMNPSITGLNRCHWSSICTSTAGTPTIDQINQTRETAVFGTGANLISPSYVLVAVHDPPIKFWFQQPDGTEISRVRGNVTAIGGTDLGIAKLDYPVYDPVNSPIRTIEPPVIAVNPQAFPQVTTGLFMEIGGRLTTMKSSAYDGNWQSGMQQNPKVDYLNVFKGYSASDLGAPLQSGDSGHPFVYTVAGNQILIGAAKGFVTPPIPGYNNIKLSNPAKYINEINAILATVGECLQTATVTIV